MARFTSKVSRSETRVNTLSAGPMYEDSPQRVNSVIEEWGIHPPTNLLLHQVRGVRKPRGAYTERAANSSWETTAAGKQSFSSHLVSLSDKGVKTQAGPARRAPYT